MDETSGYVAADSSGHGHDAQLLDYWDPTSQWGLGRVGGALSFDGYSQRVVPADGNTLNAGTDATFAFWIKPTAFGTFEALANYNRYLGRVLYKSGHFDIQTLDDPGSVRATIVANGVAAQQYTLTLNEWQHWAVVFQGGQVRFYRNGFMLGDALPGALGATLPNALILGNSSDVYPPTSFFRGTWMKWASGRAS